MQAYVEPTGAVTLPREICDQIGLKAGDEVEVGVDAAGHVTLVKVSDWATRQAKLDPDRLRKIRGTLKSDMNTDEIMLELRGERDDLPD